MTESVRAVKGNGNRPRLISFSFYPQNTDPPTIRSDPDDKVASVVRSAAGKFLVTMRERYPLLIAPQCTFTTEEDNRDMYAQGGAASPNAAGGMTFVVKLKTGATNTDIAASGTDRYVSVSLHLDDSNRYA